MRKRRFSARQVLKLDVKAGAGNVLACYVDGGLTTGWWYESNSARWTLKGHISDTALYISSEILYAKYAGRRQNGVTRPLAPLHTVLLKVES